MIKDALFSALVVIVVVVLAAVVGPKGPTGPPDPTLAGANPRPEWPFLWLFGLLSLSPPGAETVHHPRVSGPARSRPVPRPVREQSRRASPEPPAGGRAGGDRDLHGAGRVDVRRRHRALVAANDGLERRPGPRGSSGQHAVAARGAVLFQKNCRNCHALEGIGGRAGPT